MDSKGCPIGSNTLEKDLERLNRMLQAAHRSSIDIKSAYDFYILALKEFDKANLTDAFLYYDRSKYELTSAINDAKLDVRGLRFHSLRTIAYFFKIYGLYALIFGMLAILIFSYLIYSYANVTVLSVPLWAPFFAGLGSSAQILSGVIDDLRREKTIVRYKRAWYTAIPLLSLIFGYIAYLIFSSGLLAFNINSENKDFSLMFICFLSGFITNWLINRLSHISRNL
ncbi:MAG: hypothetical protein ACE14P_11620 [Methanotrichaceae archaeon]